MVHQRGRVRASDRSVRPSGARPVTYPYGVTHLAKVVAVDVGPATQADDAASGRGIRLFRDAGHEVVYLGLLAADEVLPRRLAAVCWQEDADALVLFGQTSEALLDATRAELLRGGRGAEPGEEVLVLGGDGSEGGQDLLERLTEHVRG